MNKKIKAFSLVSIVLTIEGALLTGLTSMALVALAIPSVSRNFHGSIMAGDIVMALGESLLILCAGVYGISNAHRPDKMNVCMFLATIILILAGFDLLGLMITHASFANVVVSIIEGILLPLSYLLLGKSIRDSALYFA